jgi:hypothetical protein
MLEQLSEQHQLQKHSAVELDEEPMNQHHLQTCQLGRQQ